MIFIIFNIIVLFLWISCLQVLLQENMLLYWLTEWRNNFQYTYKNRIIWYALKPVIFCAPCCCSVHGFIVTLALSDLFHIDFDVLRFVVVAMCTVPVVYFFTPKILEE